MNKQTVAVADQLITVRELTTAQLREWFARFTNGETEGDHLQELTLEDISLLDLAIMTDRSADELEIFTVAELRRIAETAKELNPHFFRLREHIRACAQSIDRQFNELVAAE